MVGNGGRGRHKANLLIRVLEGVERSLRVPQLLPGLGGVVVEAPKSLLESFARSPHLRLRLGQLVQQAVLHLMSEHQ